MRQKRAKTYRKLMSLYSMSFGFRQPYQVLVDSELCKTSVDHKIELVKQLGTVLQGEVKPMITQCCIHELYLQRGQQPPVDLAKAFERRKCNHREPISGDDCLASVVGDSNKHRYVIATQSDALRGKLRLIPAVPIVHINRSVMILEPPSDVTIRAKTLMEQKALTSTTPAEKALLASSSPDPPPKKKRGPKGPNPLSIKKKKASNMPTRPVKSLVQVHSDGKSKRNGINIGKLVEGNGEKHVSNELSLEAGKRKRTEESEADAVVDDSNIIIGEATGSSRKRKRRRKAKE